MKLNTLIMIIIVPVERFSLIIKIEETVMNKKFIITIKESFNKVLLLLNEIIFNVLFCNFTKLFHQTSFINLCLLPVFKFFLK